MVFTKTQIADITAISERCTKTCFEDNELMDKFAMKIAGLVISNIESKIDALNIRCNDMDSEVKRLRGENLELRERLDGLEQNGKALSLRMYGSGVSHGENLKLSVAKFLTEKLSVTINESDINHIYPIKWPGRKSGRNADSPAVVMEMKSLEAKNRVFNNKSKLKGTKCVIREELTKSRYELFQVMCENLERRNVWTLNGKIGCIVNGKKVYVTSIDQFERFIN